MPKKKNPRVSAIKNSYFLLPEAQTEYLTIHYFLLIVKSPFSLTPFHISDLFSYIIMGQQMMAFCLIGFQKFNWSTVQVLNLNKKFRLPVTFLSGSRGKFVVVAASVCIFIFICRVKLWFFFSGVRVSCCPGCWLDHSSL